MVFGARGRGGDGGSAAASAGVGKRTQAQAVLKDNTQPTANSGESAMLSKARALYKL